MAKPIHPTTLFRMMVLGPLISPSALSRGELKTIVENIASKPHRYHNGEDIVLSPATIERWLYLYRKGGFDALSPKSRDDLGNTVLPKNIQEAILQVKKDRPGRSIRQVCEYLTNKGLVSDGSLSHSTVHRFLQKHNLSKRTESPAEEIERRSFTAKHAGEIWSGDVMHAHKAPIGGKPTKLYLVSWMDDASRLITHSEFCLGETALDIEMSFKQALLRRGLPKRVIVDNGSAYRSAIFKGVCARLGIQLVFCRPYEPEGKDYVAYCTSMVMIVVSFKLAI